MAHGTAFEPGVFSKIAKRGGGAGPARAHS